MILLLYGENEERGGGASLFFILDNYKKNYYNVDNHNNRELFDKKETFKQVGKFVEALKAITTIKEGSISFKGLEKFNGQEVEVFVYSKNRNNSNEIKEQKRKFFQFQGIIESDFTDTSKNVDRIIHEKNF